MVFKMKKTLLILTIIVAYVFFASAYADDMDNACSDFGEKWKAFREKSNINNADNASKYLPPQDSASLVNYCFARYSGGDTSVYTQVFSDNTTEIFCSDNAIPSIKDKYVLCKKTNGSQINLKWVKMMGFDIQRYSPPPQALTTVNVKPGSKISG